ncbi:MAG: hypothetical protein JOZ19_01090, partial [Rubrobacter sp.]|nr:hypothetical protein [Rubrobacter sp.]
MRQKLKIVAGRGYRGRLGPRCLWRGQRRSRQRSRRRWPHRRCPEGRSRPAARRPRGAGTPVAEILEEAPIAQVADVSRGAAVEFTDAQLQQPAVLV